MEETPGSGALLSRLNSCFSASPRKAKYAPRGLRAPRCPKPPSGAASRHRAPPVTPLPPLPRRSTPGRELTSVPAPARRLSGAARPCRPPATQAKPRARRAKAARSSPWHGLRDPSGGKGRKRCCPPPLSTAFPPSHGSSLRSRGAEPPPGAGGVGAVRERRSVPPPAKQRRGRKEPPAPILLGPPPLPHQVSPLRRTVLSSAATSVRWVSRSAAPPSAIFSPRQQRRQRQQGQERATLHAGSDADRETPSPPPPSQNPQGGDWGEPGEPPRRGAAWRSGGLSSHRLHGTRRRGRTGLVRPPLLLSVRSGAGRGCGTVSGNGLWGREVPRRVPWWGRPRLQRRAASAALPAQRPPARVGAARWPQVASPARPESGARCAGFKPAGRVRLCGGCRAGAAVGPGGC